MSGARLTSALLDRAHRAAVRNAEMASLVTEAMRQRYGCTHSDVDCDDLIEALDYGSGNAPTLTECDRLMAACGVVPLQGGDA